MASILLLDCYSFSPNLHDFMSFDRKIGVKIETRRRQRRSEMDFSSADAAMKVGTPTHTLWKLHF